MGFFDDDDDTDDAGPSQATIQDIKSWVDSMDQTVRSLDNRLNAVERRLSEEGFDGVSADTGATGDDQDKEETTVLKIESDRGRGDLENRITALVKDLQAEKDRIEELETELEGMTNGGPGSGEIPEGLDEELDELRRKVRELDGLEQEVQKIQGKMGKIRNELDVLPDRLAVQSTEEGAPNPMAQEQVQDLEQRLGRLERRKTPTMQVGKVEIPFEFTGIVGGLIAAVIAVGLYTGHLRGQLLESPYAFGIVALALIATTLVKAILISKREDEAEKQLNQHP